MNNTSDHADSFPRLKAGASSARRINLKKESLRYSEAFFFLT